MPLAKVCILFYLFLLFYILHLQIWVQAADLPTNYEYFTSKGIASGLNADQSYFTLNGNFVQIFSGAMHYFRVPRAYWRDRLKKIRAAGLNAVETYIPWNLHEYQNGKYDFGSGGSEMEDFLHIEEFLKTAQEEDLFVILRSGPYICAEYNFGGFPSWLLREKIMGFRTSEATYMKYVTRYYSVLLPILAKYQFTKGGPVIAFQVENEYGNQEDGTLFQPDLVYLEKLYEIFINNGIVELLVTSDSPLSHGIKGTIPGKFLHTANLGDGADEQLAKLKELQPGRPLMVMEYWIGWFDYWAGAHGGKTDSKAESVYRRILNQNASVNIYMFHGGTNFGFTSGASMGSAFDNSNFKAITTSYDYDAPIAEDGSYRNKYTLVKNLIAEHNQVKTLTPEPPKASEIVAYESQVLHKQILFENLIRFNSPYTLESNDVVSMEMLDINNSSGQSDGYILYKKEGIDLPAGAVLRIGGHVCDTVMVLVNGKLVGPTKLSSADDLNSFGFWKLGNSTLTLTKTALTGATLDLVVENWGRMNGGVFNEYNHTYKGLWQDSVYVNNAKVTKWKVVPLEFKKSWVSALKGWETYTAGNVGPAVYDSVLTIKGTPSDTYLNMEGWTKGMVFVNGFPLGRYCGLGPQQTLYVPAPYLITGNNYFIIYEHFAPPSNNMGIEIYRKVPSQ